MQRIPVTLRTEAPVIVRSFGVESLVRGSHMFEVVDMAGAKIPRQVVLIDCYNDDSIGNVLGSVRELKIQNGALTGMAYFSSKASAQHVANMVLHGDIQAVAANIERKQTILVPAQEKRVYRGLEVPGPARIVTKWELYSASVLVVGTDANAKFHPELASDYLKLVA